MVLSFFANGAVVTVPVAYKDMPGFEAQDLFNLVRSLLDSWGLKKGHLVGFTADGASVMGTRAALNNPGENVATKLAAWANHPLLVTHCAPHRLQLCVISAWGDDYLKNLEKQLKALYKNLKDHPSSTIDLVFWSELVDEDVLPSLSTSKARWLSFLSPVQKLLKSYLSVLCHLMYQFQYHCNHEQKKTVSWLFQGLATWEARITLSGIADILEICMSYKNRLERVTSFTAVEDLAKSLQHELDRFCRHSSVVSSALAGDRDLPGGGTHIEYICEKYRREKGQKLHLLYTARDHLVNEWVTVKDFDWRDAVKLTFGRLTDFAQTCAEKVLDRFSAKAFWAHAHIFRPDYNFDQETFQTAIWEMGNHLNMETEPLIRQMRSAFAVRDMLCERSNFPSAELLWSKTLQEVNERGDLPLAAQLIASFLVSPSQAATCERGFATITRLRDRLGECSASVFEQYLQVGSLGLTVKEARQTGFIKELTTKFMSAKNRKEEETGTKGYRRKGKLLIPRKRKQRSDSGQKRKNYKKTKTHAGLRALPTARHLTRDGDAEVHMGEAPDEVDEHDIWNQMSPRKK